MEVLQNHSPKDPWVYIYKGRCFTDTLEYQKAIESYEQAYKLDPSRIQGTEYYSSCLYQMKKTSDLVTLAQRVHQKHFFSSETWIIFANLYSLNQDPDTALSFLQRACQIDSTNSYAYCLQGHEYSAKEQYEKSKESYQIALNLDKRNIRAYWGLGLLHLKTEKYRKAIEYFKHVFSINDETSSVYTQTAIAYMNLEDYDSALKYIKEAQRLNPNDQINRFHMGMIHFNLKQFEKAQSVCEDLLKECKKEANLYSLLGDIYRERGMKKEAYKAYVDAMNLDSTNTQKLKQKIEALNQA